MADPQWQCWCWYFVDADLRRGFWHNGVAGTRVEGFAELRHDEPFGDDETEAGLRAESDGIFGLWEGEPWSDWGDMVIHPNEVFP